MFLSRTDLKQNTIDMTVRSSIWIIKRLYEWYGCLYPMQMQGAVSMQIYEWFVAYSLLIGAKVTNID